MSTGESGEDRVDVPLCVHLVPDVLPNSVATESVLARARSRPWVLVTGWLGRRRRDPDPDAPLLPFGPAGPPCPPVVLEALRAARGRGRRVILLAAGDPVAARAVAAELDVFDEVVEADPVSGRPWGPDGRLSGRPYDLLQFRSSGGSRAAGAREVIRVEDPDGRSRAGAVLKALRVHQWLKNLLVFLPVLAGQQFDRPGVLLAAGLAFVAFSLVASSVYLVNDLLDLREDRQHPTKRRRPFASGDLPARAAPLLLVGLLGAAGILTFALLPAMFRWTIGGYLVLTFAYTLKLKGAVLIDVLTLAGLYTLRVLAGSAATGIEPSVWLLGFSFFFFTSLALVKRYAELHRTLDGGPASRSRQLPGRSYQPGDLPVLIALGLGTGCMAVLVLALYVISDEFSQHYRYSFLLWQLCPLVLYWLGRAWIVVSRDEMEDDPVVWAFRDQLSRWVGIIAVAILLLAR